MNELDLFGEALGRTLPSTKAEASERAERIRTGMVAILVMEADIKKAWAARDWAALGYASWDTYVVGEFGEHRFPKLNRQERRELVSRLRDGSMSTRAIGAVLGVDQKTVVNDLKAGEENSSPATVQVERADEPGMLKPPLGSNGEPAEASDSLATPPAQRTRGTDGKSYQASRPVAPRVPVLPVEPPRPLFPVHDEDVVDAEIVDELAVRRASDLAAPAGAVSHQPSVAVSNFLAEDPAFQDKAYLAEFSRSLAHSDDFMEFEPERIGWLASDLTMATLAQHLIHVQQFIARAQAARSKVRVIPGGRA